MQIGLITGKGQICDPEIWLYVSFIGCGELDSPTCKIVVSFVDYGCESNIYHFLQCWNGFWDHLWLENGSQDSVLKCSVLWKDQQLHIL
jgi:hypothetical protein